MKKSMQQIAYNKVKALRALTFVYPAASILAMAIDDTYTVHIVYRKSAKSLAVYWYTMDDSGIVQDAIIPPLTVHTVLQSINSLR